MDASQQWLKILFGLSILSVPISLRMVFILVKSKSVVTERVIWTLLCSGYTVFRQPMSVRVLNSTPFSMLYMVKWLIWLCSIQICCVMASVIMWMHGIGIRFLPPIVVRVPTSSFGRFWILVAMREEIPICTRLRMKQHLYLKFHRIPPFIANIIRLPSRHGWCLILRTMLVLKGNLRSHLTPYSMQDAGARVTMM